MSSATPKERLLAAVVDAALAGGITGLSLRAIAEAAGTSHRMLIHHFGSREGLLVEVIRAVEERQQAAFRDLGTGTGEAFGDTAYRFWRHLRSPELAPQERLFFEVYGQALQGRPWAAPLTRVRRRGMLVAVCGARAVVVLDTVAACLFLPSQGDRQRPCTPWRTLEPGSSAWTDAACSPTG